MRGGKRMGIESVTRNAHIHTHTHKHKGKKNKKETTLHINKPTVSGNATLFVQVASQATDLYQALGALGAFIQLAP